MAIPSGWTLSFESVNYPDLYIAAKTDGSCVVAFVAGGATHQYPSFPGVQAPDTLPVERMKFTLVPGIIDNKECFSLQLSGRTSEPYDFLCREGDELKLVRRTDRWDAAKAANAVFALVPALDTSGAIIGVSFRLLGSSEGPSNRFIRHSGYKLWVHEYRDDDLFRKDASFKLVKR